MEQIRNCVVGKEPVEAELDAGSFYWGDHLKNPIIHKASKSVSHTRVVTARFCYCLLVKALSPAFSSPPCSVTS